MRFFGVRLLGLTGENFHKLVLGVGFIAGILILRLVRGVRAATTAPS